MTEDLRNWNKDFNAKQAAEKLNGLYKYHKTKDKKKTYEWLSNKTGISKSLISIYMRSSQPMSVETVLKMAFAYEVKPTEIAEDLPLWATQGEGEYTKTEQALVQYYRDMPPTTQIQFKSILENLAKNEATIFAINQLITSDK